MSQIYMIHNSEWQYIRRNTGNAVIENLFDIFTV